MNQQKYNMYDHLSENDKSYAAGFLDGEGCFTMRSDGTITIIISNTYKPIISWFIKNFRGTVHKRKDRRKETYKTVFRWQTVSKNAFEVCATLFPYLKEKSKQAKLLMLIQYTKGKGGIVSDDMLLERKRLGELLKKEKHISWE